MDLTGLQGAGGARAPQGGRGPGQRTRILLVDGDARAAEAVATILRAEDWEVVYVRTGAEAPEKARLEVPDAILSDLTLADMGGVDLCRALHELSETATTPVFILSTSAAVADRVASLKAGAADYLLKPVNAQELVVRLKAALDLRQARSGLTVVVLGCKGGVGASVLAANLAVALRQESRGGVALVDAASHGSALDVLLNLQTARGVADLLARLDDLEPSDLEATLTPHASGLQALLLDAQNGEGIPAAGLRKALLTLRRMHDLVVVDTCSWLDETTMAALELADRVLLVLTPEITALRGARIILQHAAAIGLSRERIVAVLNRFPLRGGLQRRDIEGSTGLSVQATIADDVRLVTYSVNRGVPLVESHPRSALARQILGLARTLAEDARPH